MLYLGEVLKEYCVNIFLKIQKKYDLQYFKFCCVLILIKEKRLKHKI